MAVLLQHQSNPAAHRRQFAQLDDEIQPLGQQPSSGIPKIEDFEFRQSTTSPVETDAGLAESGQSKAQIKNYLRAYAVALTVCSRAQRSPGAAFALPGDAAS